MPKKNAEKIRRRKARPYKRNSLANVYQVLSRSVGQRWCDVKASIYDHPKLKDVRVRPAIRERLESLLAPRRRPVQPFNVFRVNHDGILERITDAPDSAAAA